MTNFTYLYKIVKNPCQPFIKSEMYKRKCRAAPLSQCGESVLTALGGCKLLREMSKQGIETEAKISMKEMAMKFENMAHGMVHKSIVFGILLTQ